MEKKDKNIDQLFRHKMEDHLEPLSADEWSAFDKQFIRKPGPLGKKVIKWLPYLAGLAAAAAISYNTWLPHNTDTKLQPPVGQTTAPQHNTPLPAAPAVTTPVPPADTLKAIAPKPISRYVARVTTNNIAAVIPVVPVLPPPIPAPEPIVFIPTREEIAQLGRVKNKTYTNGNTSTGISTPQVRSFGSISSDDMAHEGNSRRVKDETLIQLGFESSFSPYAYKVGVLGLQVRKTIFKNVQIGFGLTAKYGSPGNMKVPASQLTYDNYERKDATFLGQYPNTYTYTSVEGYDSTVIKYSLSGNMVEIELPVYVQYNFSDRWSANAGIKLTYSDVPKINRQVNNHEVRNYDTVANLSLPYIPVFPNRCECTSDNPAPYDNATNNVLRTAYMVGVQYRPAKRVELDLSLHQNLSSLDYIPNLALRKMYSLPYFRFSVGYRFSRR